MGIWKTLRETKSASSQVGELWLEVAAPLTYSRRPTLTYGTWLHVTALTELPASLTSRCASAKRARAEDATATLAAPWCAKLEQHGSLLAPPHGASPPAAHTTPPSTPALPTSAPGSTSTVGSESAPISHEFLSINRA